MDKVAPDKKMKILVHGPQVNYYFFILAVIKRAKELGLPVEWSVIMYTNAAGLYERFVGLLGKENVLYLQEGLNVYMRSGGGSLEDLKDFPASVFECVSTSKVCPGHIALQKKSRAYQRRLIAGTYTIYKEYLLKNRPDVILFPIIEMYDSFILYHLSKELSIPPCVYVHARNFGVSFFSSSIYEYLPRWADQAKVPDELVKKAASFIEDFRAGKVANFLSIAYQPGPEEVIHEPYIEKRLLHKGKSLLIRILSNVFVSLRRKRMYEPHLADKYTVVHLMKIQFLPLTLWWRRIKGSVSKTLFDIRDLGSLPEKFVYYPLQLTPEASINIPAPFFVDQMRAVDHILNALPADHFLVVREHPHNLGNRPFGFYKALRKKANVLIADYSIPGLEIIKKAALTVSVTGTSCLEAFLLGKPSLHIGEAFFTPAINKSDTVSGAKSVFRQAMSVSEVPKEKITDLVSKVFYSGDDFLLFCPGDPYIKTELVMNTKNVETFLLHLMRHVERPLP